MTHRFNYGIISKMPARIYPLVTNHYYHVYNRGVNRAPIFLSKTDYSRFVNLLRFYNYCDHPVRFSKFLLLSVDQRKEIWTRLAKTDVLVDIIAFCLIPNHFHLLLKQNDEKGISKLMANIQNGFARYVNLKYNRVGPLFQGQFKAIKIDSEEQLLHVSRYIHLNPYTSAIVGNVNKLLNYEFSSFGEYILSKPFEICNKEIIFNYFHSDENYEKFVLDNADYQKNLETIKHLTIEDTRLPMCPI